MTTTWTKQSTVVVDTGATKGVDATPGEYGFETDPGVPGIKFPDPGTVGVWTKLEAAT